MESENLQQMRSAPEAALREWMEEYGNDVWNYAYFLTSSREQADDISQEVFLKAYRYADTFRGQSSAKTWLLRITRNTVYSLSKKNAKWKQLFQGNDIPHGSYPSAEAEAMDKQYTDAIWAVVMRLPVHYRETLLLEIRYGMTAQEISALLRVPQGTVKSRLSRARDKVRYALEQEEKR